MQPHLALQFLQSRPLGYAVTDRTGALIEEGGDLPLLYGDEEVLRSERLGESLSALVPELAADEATLDALVRGERDPLAYHWINRHPVDGHGVPSGAPMDVRYATLTVQAWHTQHGSVGGLLCVAEETGEEGRARRQLMQQRDQMRLLEEKIQEQNQALHAATVEMKLMNEIKSSFCAVVAHQLRNPLASIYGYLEMLLDDEADGLLPEHRASLQIVLDNARRLLEAVRNVVDTTRIDADRMELLLRPVAADDLLAKTARRARTLLAAKQQALVVADVPALPPLLCDGERVQQILWQLLHNASKYTPAEGTIRLHIDRHDDHFVHIAVADEGPGIAPDERATLLTAPHRTRRTFRSQTGETGLGLYIARALVELHGGELWCDSEPQGGSTFHITLPLADLPAPTRPQGSVRSPSRRQREASSLFSTAPQRSRWF